MARQYNFIYKKLVDDEKDIVGNIAYSLYKTDKINFIEGYKSKNGGEEPTEKDFHPFHDNACMDSNIQRYKMQAVIILKGFLDDALSSTTQEIEQNCKDNHKQMIKDAVVDMKPRGFLYGVIQSVAGAFVFMIILCALMFILHFSDTKYTFTIGGNGNAKVEQKTQSQQSSKATSIHKKQLYK